MTKFEVGKTYRGIIARTGAVRKFDVVKRTPKFLTIKGEMVERMFRTVESGSGSWLFFCSFPPFSITPSWTGPHWHASRVAALRFLVFRIYQVAMHLGSPTMVLCWSSQHLRKQCRTDCQYFRSSTWQKPMPIVSFQNPPNR